MSTVINTNLASLFAQNSLSNAQNNLATSVQRLSSGLRINSAKDDAAGLAIAQNMQSQLNGTNQSIQNLSNATNLLQTADTSLSTIQDMLLRMKQLATQGYDGSLNATQMQDVVQQMSELNTEINQTAQRTQFNGISLIASGSSVDRKTAGVYEGQYLTTTAATLAATDSTYKMGAGVTTFASAFGNASYTPTNASSASFDIALTNDDVVRQNPGAYTFTAIGNQLTLSYTGADNVPKQQTLTVENAPYDANAPKDHIQKLDFSNFGVSLTLNTTAKVGGPEVLGSDIALKLQSQKFYVNGQASKITSIDLAGAAAGSYSFTNTTSSTTAPTPAHTVGAGTNYSVDAVTFTALKAGESITVGGLTMTAKGVLTATQVASQFSSIAASTTAATLNASSTYNVLGTYSGTLTGWASAASSGTSATFTSTAAAAAAVTTSQTAASNTLVLTWTDSSQVQHTESVALQTADFTMGSDSLISFKDAGISLKIHNFQSQTGTDIASLIANQSNPLGTTFGKLNVVNPGSASLDFQSGPGSNSFITIDTLNVMTGVSGQYSGDKLAMTQVGSKMDILNSNNAQTTTEDWQTAFKNASAAIDQAIDYISTKRSTFGSQMNRLSYITTNLTAQSTNLQSSKSAIMDTNFASETATLTKGQIMQQAATAMLAQANQMPNVILSLLK